MTRLRRIVLAAAAFALATPALGQAPASHSPDEDLRCAAWAAIVLGINQDDPEVATGFGMALAWFVARYEGATGKPFEQAMTAEFLDSLAPELEVIEQACQPRMQEMGARFSDWGAQLQATGQ